MPKKPKTPCRYPNCKELVDERYCEHHKKIVERNYNKYERDKKSQKFYQSIGWKTMRKRKLAQNPFCEECEKQNKFMKASMVDHIRPIRQGGDALDINNLQSLCWSCHSRKSAQEGSRWGK